MSPPKTTACQKPIRTLRDIEALEQQPYEELVPARSVYDLFRNTAALHGDRPALTLLAADADQETCRLTHRELLAAITQAANLFTSLGVGPGDVVALIGPVHAPVPALLWGAQTAGVVSCLNYLLSAEALLDLLRAEKAKVVVCPGPELDPQLWERISSIIDRVDTVQVVVTIGGGATGPRVRALEPLLAAQRSDGLDATRTIARDTPAALFHTGGTTGGPKLVPHTHGNIVHAAWCFAQAFGITEQDVGLNGLPMFHVGGTSTWGLSILGAGGHVIVLTPTGFRNAAMVRNYWALVERYRATMLGAVPTSIGALSEVPLEGHDISSARMAQTGGAVLPAAVAERFENLTGVPLLEQYGMTETVAAISFTPFYGKHVRGSVGLRCPFADVAALKKGPDGSYVRCAPGESGLIACKGPHVFSGYVDPRHNEKAWTPDGWFISGDLGHLDEDGYLVLTGREKDLIIRSGHNIDPASIEAVANAHPTVALSAAVGMPDAYAGEVPVVFVTPVQGMTVDEAGLASHLKANVDEPPARPRHIFVLESMPLTAVGKVFKPRLREMAIEEKLRMEVGALAGGVSVHEVRFGDAATGGVTLVLRSPSAAGSNACKEVETRLTAAFRDLQFQPAITWS
jgi:fatty-acyl-CoA synthase